LESGFIQERNNVMSVGVKLRSCDHDHGNCNGTLALLATLYPYPPFFMYGVLHCHL